MVRSRWGDVVVVALMGCGDNTSGVVDAPVGSEPFGPAVLTATPGSVDFGSMGITTEAFASLTVTNIGQTASGPLLTSLTGVKAGSFATAGTTCTTLAPSATCTVSLTFAPMTVGAKSATLTLTASSGGDLMVPLAGTALTGPGGLIVTPQSHYFGVVTTGALSAARTFTIYNPSGITFGALTVTPTGTNATDFAIASQTCSGTMLAPGASCTLDVQFTPALIGPRSASFTMTANPGGTASATVVDTGR